MALFVHQLCVSIHHPPESVRHIIQNTPQMHFINCGTNYIDCDKMAYFSCYHPKVDHNN